ncbi:MAG TPA: hypothetical protein VKB79_19405 [Bryobacteraceae bacterium]|nr:hypothetical protein [Bryobacteraceae bacterium]
MIPELRRDFNARFTAAKYSTFLSRLDERCGTHVKFRISETPCFFPDALLNKMRSAGAEMIRQLVQNETYLAEARRQIPDGFLVRNEAPRPLFAQADFGIVRQPGGRLTPKLVEIQGFPSLYAFQPALEDTYRECYALGASITTAPDAGDLLKRAILGNHAPENVALLEIDPEHQKTLPDFLLTSRRYGIRVVDIREVRKRGQRLYVGDSQIKRIYNRVIADEMIRRDVQADFRFDDDLDVEWAGHPNWFFLISKFSLPYLRHESVPESEFLDQVDATPQDLENYVLKPLYSFAGLGVKVEPTRADVDGIPDEQRPHYLLQKRMRFEPLIETPEGPTMAEVRIMYIWLEELKPVGVIVRMGRGRMMGVDHNRDMAWVGASAAFTEAGV